MERFSLRKAWEDTRFMLGFIWREDKKIFLYKYSTRKTRFTFMRV